MGQLAPSAIAIINLERKKLKVERLTEQPPIPPSLPPPVSSAPGLPVACPWAPCRPRALRVFRPHPTLYIPQGLSNFYPKSQVSSIAAIMQTPPLPTSLQTSPLTAGFVNLPYTEGLETPPLSASFGSPFSSCPATPRTPDSFPHPSMLASPPLKPALKGPPLKPMLATLPPSPVLPLSPLQPLEPVQFPDPPLATEMEVEDEGASLH